MLTVTLILVPAGFALAVWHSYRRERQRAAHGEGYAPEGRVRWSGPQRGSE